MRQHAPVESKPSFDAENDVQAGTGLSLDESGTKRETHARSEKRPSGRDEERQGDPGGRRCVEVILFSGASEILIVS